MVAPTSLSLRIKSHTRYFICPNCGRKTVRGVMRPNGEDHYRCTAPGAQRPDGCGFYAFIDASAEDDAANLYRLWQANELHRECVCGLNGPPEWYLARIKSMLTPAHA